MAKNLSKIAKAKYGVILAVIIIIVVNIIYYKETIFSFFK